MLTITIQVNAPSGQAIGIKEDIATYLEKFGDAKVVSVVEKLPEQLRVDAVLAPPSAPGRQSTQPGTNGPLRTSRPRTAKQGASAPSLNAAPPGERSQARGNAE